MKADEEQKDLYDKWKWRIFINNSKANHVSSPIMANRWKQWNVDELREAQSLCNDSAMKLKITLLESYDKAWAAY